MEDMVMYANEELSRIRGDVSVVSVGSASAVSSPAVKMNRGLTYGVTRKGCLILHQHQVQLVNHVLKVVTVQKKEVVHHLNVNYVHEVHTVLQLRQHKIFAF